MVLSAWDRGATKAAADYGLTKHAWSSWKELFVGSPAKYLAEATGGELFTRKGLLAKSLNPRVEFGPKWLRKPATALNASLAYGLPMYGVYEASKTAPEQRGSAIGSTVGSLIGSTLGMPLGLVGSTAGNMLGGALGESLGRTFNRKEAEPTTSHDPRMAET